jgi:predicted MPP superfamily phosphohydrolase
VRIICPNILITAAGFEKGTTMTNTKCAIIHVADIHYRKDAPEGAASIVKAFLKDLKEQVETLQDYHIYIAITGDVVRAGSDIESYQAFITDMDFQLEAMGLPKDSRIVIPGNHDLDRALVRDKFAEYEEAQRRHTADETSFNDFMSNPNILSDKFENFELFVSEFTGHGESFSRLGWGLNINDDVGVYCLNTALCSFGGENGVKDEGQLAIFSRGLVEWCNSTNTSTNILMLHHPFDHLNPWSRTELQHIVENNFTLCLCGHNHLPEVYHSRVPSSSLHCTAPPLFCGKTEILAYSVILIENGEPSSILYREYSDGQFFPGSRLAKKEDGILKLDNTYLHHLKGLEDKLKNALESYKGQPEVLIKPKLSESRELNNEPNLLDGIIANPENAVIVAPPQFGLTCLSLHMRVEAFKNREFWIYIDAQHMKARNVLKYINEELHHYGKESSEIKSIMIDGWDAGIADHINVIKKINEEYSKIPLMLFSNRNAFLDPGYKLDRLEREFRVLHLQPLSRSAMRELVSGYYGSENVTREDEVLSHMTTHMESINIHRTSFNCLTLLRVHGSDFNEKLLNKTKLMRAYLFVLFTDADSFLYSDVKPDVDECTAVLGAYCKGLVRNGDRSFSAQSFISKLKQVCEDELITLDVDGMVDVLVDNHILVRYGEMMEFKHTCWIFYFAAGCMLHDDEFKSYILSDQNYANFPEIIDFYSGIDGQRADVLQVLLTDLNGLIDKVDESIGISGPFNPLSNLVWNPSESFAIETRKQIAEKLDSSNLPPEIKDQHADNGYNSKAPYDQSIHKVLNEYSVLCLVRSIAASSRALRNSALVKPAKLKVEVAQAIFKAWEEVSKVIFWISPFLARDRKAAHDGFSLVLTDQFSEDLNERFKQIIIANPMNVVRLLKDDLSSKKIGKLLYGPLKEGSSDLQKHFTAIFLAEVRPVGWYEELLEHLNRLHPSSYYLGDLLGTLQKEVKLGFIDEKADGLLKNLIGAVLAKRQYASKALINNTEAIPEGMMLSDENKLPIDQLLAKHDPSAPDKYGKQLRRKKG